jgi:hypothetical protein
MIHSGNATRNRKEERLLRERLADMEAKLDRALAMEKKEVGASPLPTPFDDEDVQCLAERLAEDRSWLPHGAHVETRAEDVTSPLQRPYGATYTNLATSISIPIIGTFTPRELLETGLVTKGGKFQAHVYERLLSEVDGVVKGKLIGPRDLMIARQNEARAKHPRLWSNG